MKIFVAPILLLLLAPLAGFSQIKLEKQLFLNNRVELLIPEGFLNMSTEVIKQKYGDQGHQPAVVFADYGGDVDIFAVILDQQLQSSQIKAFKTFQINTLKKSKPNAEWLDDGVRTINGKSVGYFKYISNDNDEKVFNYYFFTDMNGKVLLVTFNCREDLLPKWKDTAETIVSSLKVK